MSSSQGFLLTACVNTNFLLLPLATRHAQYATMNCTTPRPPLSLCFLIVDKPPLSLLLGYCLVACASAPAQRDAPWFNRRCPGPLYSINLKAHGKVIFVAELGLGLPSHPNY
jgi:hypothetical protein